VIPMVEHWMVDGSDRATRPARDGAHAGTGSPTDGAQDRPLSGRPFPPDKLHPAMYAAELAGTALLVVLGISSIIALWGKGAPFSDWPLPSGPRRLVNGFLFGSIGAAIAYSPLGRISGAHINPAMTFAFYLARRLQWRDASCYVLAQIVGAAVGAALLLLWGRVGASAAWGASTPPTDLFILWPIAGEIVCTFLLVALVFLFASRAATQPFTPLINPPLFALLSWLEAPLSGASANPARSLGPELIGQNWAGWWVYWLGPAVGAALAVAAHQAKLFGHIHLPQARLFHFGHHGGVGR
jgi:aquaporin Z